jgi:thioredoxin reductase (NADPH)
VAYRRLDAPGVAALEGRGVYYGASIVEAEACKDQTVVVVGGANSAGQAAVYLSRQAGRVLVVVRGASLEASMSHYLVEQIAAIGTIEVRTGTRVAAAEGEGHLAGSSWRARKARRTSTSARCSCSSAPPPTRSGSATASAATRTASCSRARTRAASSLRWPLERDPFLLETTLPGVFVAGDVRHRSVKRVASAVGEGSMSVQFIHQYLADR